MAASMVLTLRRDLKGTTISVPSDQNPHVPCADTAPNEITSCEATSCGIAGGVRLAR